MKDLKELLGCMLIDIGMRCRTDTSKDINTMSRRTEHEGVSFLTITLPSFCRDLERGLEEGQVRPSDFPGFRKLGETGAIPSFLRGMLALVFDSSSGVLLDNPDVEAVLCMRQLLLSCKKILLPCKTKRERSALDAYVQIDESLADETQAIPEGPTYGPLGDFGFVSRVLWSEVLGEEGKEAHSWDFVPKHGRGTTAERVLGNQKDFFSEWPSRLDEHFPMDQFVVPNANWMLEDEVQAVRELSPGAERPVRVITVPKTLTAPRIIAAEPVAMQYAQQSVLDVVIRALESHRYTKGRINFSDQSLNQRAALEASVTKDRATIDLSEASDRVAAGLVYTMLSSVPHLRDAVFACRSTSAKLPNGKIIRLRKFASMGSALTFPVEAMVFLTIIVAARARSKTHHLRARLTKTSVIEALEGVLVYGDDIIVPAGEVTTVIEWLEAFGLKVNRRKTFVTGNFRESCGMDAFMGERVTPVYLRRPYPTDRHDASSLISWVSYANQLYLAGYWRTARHVRAKLTKSFGRFPHVLDTSPGLGWCTFRKGYNIDRWDNLLHRPLVRALVASPRYKPDPIEGFQALLKCLRSPVSTDWWDITVLDPKHLSRSVCRDSTADRKSVV